MATPRFRPLVGGAATYSGMLAEFLASQDAVRRVAVLAPYARGAPIVERRGKMEVYRVLMPRSDRPAVRALLRVISSAITVLVVVMLAVIRGVRVVHVHASLSRIGRSVPDLPLEWTIRTLGLRGILDLRDPIVKPRRSHAWRATICASRAIERSALAAGIGPSGCRCLPPPVDVARVASIGERTRSTRDPSIGPAPYICYVGEITAWKGVAELVDAVHALGGERRLVLVGPLVARGSEEQSWPRMFEQDPLLRWLGPRPWEATIAILAQADLVVVPSRSDHEGIPRVCLEALALGRRVLFPAGVREFEESDPDWIVGDTSPAGLAAAMGAALARPGMPRYDLSVHDPARVFSRYLELYR